LPSWHLICTKKGTMRASGPEDLYTILVSAEREGRRPRRPRSRGIIIVLLESP
jgi:hypothetical protein